MKPWLLDVTVVLAAHRDDHSAHYAVRPWFDHLLADDLTFTVPSLVRGSFSDWLRTAGY